MALLGRFLTGSFIPTFAIGIFVYLLFIIIRSIVRFKQKKDFFDKLPGFKPEQKHWISGHAPLMIKDNSINIDVMVRLVKENPKFYRVWIGSFRPIVHLTHPETVKVLLKTAEPKPVGFGGSYTYLLPWIGEGILVAGGAKWARARRLLTPAFHFEILRSYQQIYNKCTDNFLDIIEKYADSGESFELFQLVSNCTLDIILQCAFSYHTYCQKDRHQHSYCRSITELALLLAKRFANPFHAFNILYNSSADGKAFKKHCDYIHEVADKVIASRKAELESGKVEKKKYLDFLDILLSAADEDGKGLSKTDIRAEVDTFMFEGHDTTTSGISWILYELAKHQNYQKACQEEIDQVMKNNKGYVTWENLSQFEFLTQCIKEGMRMHPPVPMVSRMTTREFTMEGTTFPPKTFFTINIYGVHHNPVVWKNHETYDPSRFSKVKDAEMDSFSFIPFAAGPRNCIGQHFAMNEEKVMIARILERFILELDPSHSVKEQFALVLRARNGIKCFAKRREK